MRFSATIGQGWVWLARLTRAAGLQATFGMASPWGQSKPFVAESVLFYIVCAFIHAVGADLALSLCPGRNAFASHTLAPVDAFAEPEGWKIAQTSYTNGGDVDDESFFNRRKIHIHNDDEDDEDDNGGAARAAKNSDDEDDRQWASFGDFKTAAFPPAAAADGVPPVDDGGWANFDSQPAFAVAAATTSATSTDDQ